jgi:hypothetical protein
MHMLEKIASGPDIQMTMEIGTGTVIVVLGLRSMLTFYRFPTEMVFH